MLGSIYISDKKIDELRKAGFDEIADQIEDLNIRHSRATSELSKAQVALSETMREVDDLQCRLDCTLQQKFANFASDECWIFQDNGEDYLESLVCPVVIDTDKLIELVEIRDKFKNQNNTT